VTDDLDHQVRQALQRRRRSPRILLVVGVLAVIAATATYIGLNLDRLVQVAFSAARQEATPVAAKGEETVTLKDFQSLQRQTADSLQSAAQEIAAQRADLKNLSDLVSSLTTKIDALQSAAAPAPQRAAVPVRPPVIAARKKPPAPKTTGPISVGGSPLPTTPPGDR